jgi:CheY-like chemotaxis protein
VSSDGVRVRVVLADDDGESLKSFASLLESLGFAEVVGLAHDGIEAIDRVLEIDPDIVLMDLEMPRCDGIEATRRIVAMRPETDVILVSASADAERIAAGYSAGARAYVNKNLELVEMLFLLVGGLRRRDSSPGNGH